MLCSFYSPILSYLHPHDAGAFLWHASHKAIMEGIT